MQPTVPPKVIALGAFLATGPNALLPCLLDACDAIAPLVRNIYDDLHDVHDDEYKTSVLAKSDGSPFTLADGMVQALLERLLRNAGVVLTIVGEEDLTSLSIDEPPYSVAGVVAPEPLFASIEKARNDIDRICQRLKKNRVKSMKLVAFIDPIDGTREFGEGKGEQCTICVGIADKHGYALGGLIYRPLDKASDGTWSSTWAYGTEMGKVPTYEAKLRNPMPPRPPHPAGPLLASNSRLSDFVTELARAMGVEIHRAGGAGNKVLLLLEGVGGYYIQDRGLSRWDTCAADAILKACGGFVWTLEALASRGINDSYCYRPVTSERRTNCNFEADTTLLTKYNAAPGALDAAQRSGRRFAQSAAELLPYANGLGLIASTDSNGDTVSFIHEAVKEAAAVAAPEFS